MSRKTIRRVNYSFYAQDLYGISVRWKARNNCKQRAHARITVQGHKNAVGIKGLWQSSNDGAA